MGKYKKGNIVDLYVTQPFKNHKVEMELARIMSLPQPGYYWLYTIKSKQFLLKKEFEIISLNWQPITQKFGI